MGNNRVLHVHLGACDQVHMMSALLALGAVLSFFCCFEGAIQVLMVFQDRFFIFSGCISPTVWCSSLCSLQCGWPLPCEMQPAAGGQEPLLQLPWERHGERSGARRMGDSEGVLVPNTQVSLVSTEYMC